MSLSLQSYASVVSTAVAAAQGACETLLTLGVGTPGRALLEATGGVSLWLQYLAIQIMLTTRLATSQGTDCDSFVNDFGMTRLPGVQASGLVTMMSFSPGSASAVVQPGAIVRTVGAISYAVMQDSTQATWNAVAGGYVRPAGTASIMVPVQALQPGSAGNVGAGAICLLGSAIAGIDTVSNAVPFVNGTDGESDAALRARFPLWLTAKATACQAAIENAVVSTQNGLTYGLQDGLAPDGTSRPGYFTISINDGSGAPPDSLLSSVYASVDAVRACGVAFAVQAPLDMVLSVAMTIMVPAGSDTQAVQTAVTGALTADIDAQQVGAGYAYSRLAVIAWNSAGVVPQAITGVLLNGAQTDIPGAPRQSVSAGTISVTVMVAQ